MEPRICVITGVSSGFGREQVEPASGCDRVVAGRIAAGAVRRALLWERIERWMGAIPIERPAEQPMIE
jgi:NAD(P)-dependent dehydrogenase (short-subunit alcohol dehydrogenase family)